MTARDPGRRAKRHSRRCSGRSGSDRVELGDLDLASFASIRAFAAWLLDRHDRLDVLVANAGLISDWRLETEEGFELMFGVNHLGHFLLTDLLTERLVASAPARVVVVSSVFLTASPSVGSIATTSRPPPATPPSNAMPSPSWPTPCSPPSWLADWPGRASR